MNSIQTVTLNSALSHNWVGCTVRTPKTQVARTLRAQGPCRGRCCAHNKFVARMSRVQPAQVARMLGVHWSRHAQAACPRPGRDIVPKSRPPEQLSQVATSTPCRDLPYAQLKPPRSRPQIWGRDTNFQRPAITMSRHQIGVATPLRPIQVATPKPGRDPPGGYPMSRHQFYVATSPTATHVVTSKMMSRLQAQSSQFQPDRDVHFWSRPQANQTRS